MSSIPESTHTANTTDVGAGASDVGATSDHTMDEQQTEMMSNLNEMRKKTLAIGTKVLISKFGSGTDCASIVNQIREYIVAKDDRSEISEKYLTEAETLYSQVETLLETSVPKSNMHTTSSETRDYKSSIVSHKVTVKGDEHDISRCIILAKAAMENNQLDDAERLLLKAERIHPSNQARELLEKLKEKKVSVTVEHQSGNESGIDREDDNFGKRDQYLDRAKIAIAEKDFETAKKALKVAQAIDPLFDITPMLDLCEDAIKERKIKINIYLELAKEAVDEENFKEAMKYCLKIFSLDKNCDIAELFSITKSGLIRTLIQKVQKCVNEKQFLKALVKLQEIKNFATEISKSPLWASVQEAIVEQEHLKTSANNAIKDRDFLTAKEILFNISRKYPEVNIEDLLERVEAGIASTSSSCHIFKCIDELKKSTDDCLQIILEAIDRKEVAIAEDILKKVQENYSCMNIEELCRKVDSLKMTETCDVPEPSRTNNAEHRSKDEATRNSASHTTQEAKASHHKGAIKKEVSTATDKKKTKENDQENRLLKGDSNSLSISTQKLEKGKFLTSNEVIITKIFHSSQSSASSSKTHSKLNDKDTSDHVCSEFEHKLKKLQHASRRKENNK